MNYTPEDIVEMMVAQGSLEVAIQNFRGRRSIEAREKLSEAIYLYKRIVPKEIRQEIIRDKEKNDLEYLAQLELDRYNEACFANK